MTCTVIFIHGEIIKGHRITESIRNNFGSVSQHFAPREAGLEISLV
ncbi:hypothetical protein CKAH01_02872 [Colletotrichum kahawae]|uniref:Uncharacterized protein n=1 Tax=Colletotrichum kahawae TaxID=34407 RepID=A0AAE0CWW3_COLKA|nr:hypothetical protein CKAH01_02872 [Colletotrichum kahawae]